MYQKFVKRLVDLILSCIALPLFLIILFVVGPIIYFQDRGDVFFNAPRLGENGKVFKMYKFRTMKVNAPDLRNKDGSTFNAEDDPRLTRIGKFLRRTSIDEIPQILNVVLGDMSLIGPRPDLPEHKKMYKGDEIRKLEVKPGITGYNQAYFRNSIPWSERIRNDIYYIDNLSFWLDVKVFGKTIRSILMREDVFVRQTENDNGGKKNA